MALVGKVVVAQGGGPTAVINQSLVGVVLDVQGVNVAGPTSASMGPSTACEASSTRSSWT